MFTASHLRRAATRALLTLVVAACSKGGDAPPAGTGGPTLPTGKDPKLLVTALDSATMSRMEERTGDWQDADASSTFRALASQGKVRAIDETMRVGESSSRRVTHYYTDDGKVAAYYEFRIQTVNAPDRSPTKEFVLFKFELTADTVSYREKNVNGAEVAIEQYEFDNARKHSLDLLAKANSAPVTTPAKP
ncbi:MAG: hypothetical protein ACO1Q7_14580 [Gemmatimonas sp.]